LGSYAAEHFSLEERLMRDAGYPDYERHRKLHEDFVARVANVRQELRGGAPLVVTRDVDWMLDWYESHIRAEDSRLTPYL